MFMMWFLSYILWYIYTRLQQYLWSGFIFCFVLFVLFSTVFLYKFEGEVFTKHLNWYCISHFTFHSCMDIMFSCIICLDSSASWLFCLVLKSINETIFFFDLPIILWTNILVSVILRTKFTLFNPKVNLFPLVYGACCSFSLSPFLFSHQGLNLKIYLVIYISMLPNLTAPQTCNIFSFWPQATL